MFVLASIYTTALMLLFLVVGVTMTLVVLVQRPKGGGLAGAFGGASTDAAAAFGASIGDVLTWVTVAFFVVWIGLAIGLQWSINHDLSLVPATTPAATTTEQAAPATEQATPATDQAEPVTSDAPQSQPADDAEPADAQTTTPAAE